MTLISRILIAAKVVLLTILAASCKEEIPSDAIVSVGSSHLTLSDLRSALPKGLSEADSASFAEAYISGWISDRLVTEVAVKHLPDTREIDRMAEDYRRQLIMWEYTRLKVSQDPSLAVSDDYIAGYYSTHKGEFTTTEPMVRGIYVRMASDSPSLADVKRWHKSMRETDIERLEKVGIRTEVTYDYFRDRWVPLSQVRAAVPAALSEKIASPQPSHDYEAEQEGFTNMLHITEVLPAGSQMPLEVASPLISRRLEARNRADIERKLRADLLRQATADGTIRRLDSVEK
ncbi:MAG: hypothetical protein K2M97_06960 [Muribaculaceae bacterium]|nr:hypothetical protein [Muribaculaceae bacterium]